MTTRSTSKAADPAAPDLQTVELSSLTLAQRLAFVRAELGGGVEKKGRNTAQSYDFVKAGDVSRQVYDALHKFGVYATPSYTMVSDQLVQWPSRSGVPQFMVMMRCSLQVGTSDTPLIEGDMLVVETIGFGADSGDKGPYKAMTGALKYALLHAVGLATDDDPEVASREEAATSAPSEPRRVGPQAAEAAAPAATETTAVGDDPNAAITTAQSKLIFAKAHEAGLDVSQFRSLVFLVTSKRSSKQLVSKEVDEILAGLQDKDVLSRAKSETAFDATVGQAPDPTKDPKAEADRIASEAARITGGEVVE